MIPSSEQSFVGRKLGQYEITGLLGTGGMGVVYRAHDTKLNRPVAIKFLSDELADAAARRRFQREAQTASSLNHPHILTVYDAGEFDGRQYLITEFIDGGTLDDWVREQKPTWRDVVELLIGIADGLGTAHTAGILHRDIKPANILVAKNGYAKLVDFGLAKLEEVTDPDATRKGDTATRPGVVIGTVAYMSPEQASGKPLDLRSDVFSFGVSLYEALSGVRPFQGATTLELMQAIIHLPPKPLGESIPMQLRMVVEKALEKDPADRYQTMRDMVTDLRRIARQSDASAAFSTARKKSSVWIWVAAAMLVVAIIAAFLLRTPDAVRPNPGQYVQLTNFADSASQPALSPDGRMMAFVRGPETFIGPGQIYVKLMPAGDPVQLTGDDLLKMYPRFSADGTQIAYSTYNNASGFDTWIVPVLGGQEPRRFLVNSEGLNWIQERLENGTTRPRLLFSEVTGKGITLAVVSSTESRSDPRTVYVEDGVMEHFSYLSPDGKQLLLAEMGFNGWQPCRLAPYDGSSRGRKIGPATGQCSGAAWSPDGKWMYFSFDAGNGFHIWRQRFPDGKPEQVTFGTTEEEGIEFAADGSSFLTSVGTRQSTLWIHDSRGDRQITSEAYSFQPVFSPDGRKLYYLVRGGENTTSVPRGSLWVMDVASSERQRLLPDYLMENYSISQDGRRVVFVTAADTAQRGVWLAELNGRSAPRRLADVAGLQAFFGVGETAGEVFFAAVENEGNFVYRVREDGTNLRKVTLPHPVFYLYGISPDGKHLAAWVNSGRTDESANSVRIYEFDGSAVTTICNSCGGRSGDEPGFVNWSLDGKFLYITFWRMPPYAVPLRRGQILPSMPPAGIRVIEDAAALPGAKPFPVPGAFPGPDPSVYAYAKLTAQRNIYRVPVP